MRTMKRLITLSLLCGLTAGLAACGESGDTEPGEETQIRELTLAHYKVPCEGVDRQLCLVARDKSGGTELLYDGIEGFDFEWGQRVVVEVREEAVPNPPMDGSSVRLILEDVVNAANDRSSFELDLSPGDLVETANGLSLLGQIGIECATEEICRTVQAQMSGGMLTVKARAGETADAPLQLFRIM